MTAYLLTDFRDEPKITMNRDYYKNPSYRTFALYIIIEEMYRFPQILNLPSGSSDLPCRNYPEKPMRSENTRTKSLAAPEILVLDFQSQRLVIPVLLDTFRNMRISQSGSDIVVPKDSLYYPYVTDLHIIDGELPIPNCL